MGLFSLPSIEKLQANRDIKGLIKALNVEDYSRDRHAVVALGELGDTSAVEPLFALLENEERRVWRGDIALALGKIGDKRAVEPLIRTLDDRANAKEAAIALGQIGDVRAVTPLVQLLGDNAFNDELIAYALAEFGADSVEPLISALSDGGPRGRRESAAIALGLIRDRRAVDHLIPMLKDEDMMVLQAAARALGFIGDLRAVGPLITELHVHDPNASAFPIIVISLVRIGGDEAEAAIFEYWRNHPYDSSHWPDDVVLALVSKAQIRKVPDLNGALAVLCDHSNSDIGKSAREALAVIGN